MAQPKVRTNMHVAPSAAGANIAQYQSLPAWRQRLAEREKKRQAALQYQSRRRTQNPAEAITELMQNPFPALAGAAANALTSAAIPQYHQVTRNDRSMEDIALRYNVPLNELTSINRTRTLPPVGSYLQLVAQGVPPSVASSITGGTYRPQTSRPVPQPRGGEDFFNRHAPAIRSASQINQQLAAGQLPDQIPVGALPYIRNRNGQPLTTQIAQQLGYVMNSNGMLVRSDSPAATAGGIQPPSREFMQTQAYKTGTGAGVPFLNQLRYDPETKKYHTIEWFLKKGKLDIKTGKAKKGKKKPKGNKPTAPVVTTAEGPQTILDIHLGSG